MKTEYSDTRLDFSDQELDEVPINFSQYPYLEELYLGNNCIEELNDIGELRQLKFLNASQNRLESIPASFGNLENLEKLYLNENLLEEIPDSIGNLDRLQRSSTI